MGSAVSASASLTSDGPCLVLALAVTWDGRLAREVGHASLALSADGLQIMAESLDGAPTRVPTSAPGVRVADLWRFDVIEVFVAGDNGYLEVELGPDGRFLVLSFDAPRRRTHDHEGLSPVEQSARTPRGWTTTATIPWALLPTLDSGASWRLNAFASLAGQLYAWSPLPGERADFHQPARYPAVHVRLPEGA